MKKTKFGKASAVLAALAAAALTFAGCDNNTSPGGGDPGFLSSAGLWNADTQTLAQSSQWIQNIIGYVNDNPGTNFVLAKDSERVSAPPTGTREGFVLGYGTNLTIVSIRAAGTIVVFPLASSSHRFFTVGDGATLTLGNNITMEGRGVIGAIPHGAAMIRVEDGGRLNMRDNSMITRHRNTNIALAEYRGAVVHIASGGTLDMGGTAEIYNNRQGGVYLSYGSDFVMTDWTGSIQNNHFGTGTITPGTTDANVIMLSSHSLHDELSPTHG